MRVNRKKYFRPYKERRGDTNLVVRAGPWKGIHNVEIDTFELYDLASDPGEQHNAAADQPLLVQRLRAFSGRWLKACVTAGANQPASVAGEMTDTVRERLRSLGYVD
jgi:arylsulfatase A-like enzyme